MPLPIDETREDIINRLASLRTAGIFVRGLPDQQGQFGTPENGIITVVKIRDEFDPPKSSDRYRQDRRMRWLFDIRLDNFVGQAGAETITEAIASLLIGFQPRHCKKMYLQRMEYIPGQGEAGRWIHEIEAIAPSLLFEPDVPDTAPPLLRVVHEVIEANGQALDPVLSRATDDEF